MIIFQKKVQREISQEIKDNQIVNLVDNKKLIDANKL
jgi:hypothetical protein